MRKNFLTVLILLALTVGMSAQESAPKKSPYQFTVVKEMPITSIKNQNKSGTCWSFSTVAFLESELLRMGKGTYDLSEMFFVWHSYFDKSVKFIRLDGKLNYGPGSSFTDAMYDFKTYGIVPDSVLNGLNYGEKMHVHGEMDAALDAYVNAIRKNENGKFSTAWENGLKGILNAYLGTIPEKFTYKGKEYTPLTFAKSLGLNADDYVSITSYTHHPFYTQFGLEVPDNWRWDLSYNVPVDDMMATIDYSLEHGYTVLWAADVSEKGFTRKGLGIVPAQETANAEQKADTIPAEKSISQEDRQIAFDNGQTTDDHGMLIYGIAKDQNGKKYYMVKNSWGLSGDYKGIWYVSETYVKYKTMDILVNKNSVPKAVREKLNF